MSHPPPGRGRARAPGPPSPSPLHFRPPSPWAPSPPPLISGPRHSSALLSPRPSPHPASPLVFQPHPVRPTPAPPVPQPYRGSPTSPAFSISSYGASPAPEYFYSSPYEPAREYEYVGVPLEPPRPMYYEVEEEERGPSTAEIIANQSQDYVDEKLAEYQMTIHLLQDEQERVQKKTFVNWINSYLSKRVPPLRVDDLIHDLRDGTKLLALLEVLSGERLPVERGRVLRRPHFLSNANSALRFLAGRRIKLVNINAADLVDGRPPVVLGLIWTIILYFQIEENSRALEYLGAGLGGSQSSLDSAGTHASEARQERWRFGARKTLLQWVANALPKDAGIEVNDFGSSWRDGIAFLAIIDAIKANLINLAALKKATNRQRLETAFTVAENELGISRLLDAEDVDVEKPDERSIMTYVAQFLHKYPEPKTTGPDAVAAIQQEYNELLQWLYRKIDYLQHQKDTNSLPMKYSDYAHFKSEVDQKELTYTKLKNLVESQSMITITMDSWKEINRLWTNLDQLLRHWLWLLDSKLPGDFGAIGQWLATAEYMLYFDQIPTALDEEAAGIISNKIEEHSAFFADLSRILERFENAKRSPEASQVPSDQLLNMERRLYQIQVKAPERKSLLKFLEHKCCLVAFLNLTQSKLRGWTVKYGREPQVQALLEDYQNFVSRNKIFQEFNKAYSDFQQVVTDYKRICHVDAKESYEIDRFIREISDTWKHVSTEIRCVQSMLEEVILYWQRWTPLVDEFESWLNVAQTKMNVPEEEKMEFFQDITIWKDKHQLLGESVSFLAATCEDQVGIELKNRYISLTNRWEHIFGEMKQYMHAGDILRHRKDYKAGIDSLSQWLRHAEHVLGQQPLASTEKIKDYGEQLAKLQSQVEEVEELFKNISKTFQSMITDLPRDEVDRIMNTLKKEKEALVKVRALIPIKLHLYHQLLVQQESLETGQREINSWLDQAENLLTKTTFEGGREVIEERLEIHKSFFSRTTYYKSMLESKNKVFQNIVKSVDNDKSIDTTESVQTMRHLNDRFASTAQIAHQQDMRLQEVCRCWNNFAACEKNITDWLNHAETLLQERNVDSKQTIEYHKSFFTHVNEKLIHDLVQSGRDLLQCLPREEQPPVSDRVERLQEKWQEVLSYAPLHLMRLEFRLDETIFQQYIKEIEKEIIYEQQVYNQNDDAEAMLSRNDDYFHKQGKVIQVERCLQNLKKISASYAQQQQQSGRGGVQLDGSLDESLARCAAMWEASVRRVEHFRHELQQVPARWEAYRDKFQETERWMQHVDHTMNNIVREVDSSEAFEREKSIFQTICREADSKREDMKWLVQNLDLLSSHCSEQEATAEQLKLENLISRYKNLIPTIEITMVKTETYTRCYTYRREVHEVICILERVKDQSVKDEKLQSLQTVERLIMQQQSAVNELDQQRPAVMSMLQRGRDLVKDTHTPAFVRDEVHSLEHGWSDAYSTTTDKLHKLRDTQKVWSNYEYQKEDLLTDLGRVQEQLAVPITEGGVSNLAKELRETNNVYQYLEQAKVEKLPQLKSTYADLCSMTGQEPKPVLEKEIIEIENKVSHAQESAQEKAYHLEKYSTQWKGVEEKIENVKNWVQKESPQVISQIQSETITPEERVEKSQQLQSVISEKMDVINSIYNEASQLADESRIQEANKLKADVTQLEMMMVDLKNSSINQSQAVEHDLASWKKYQQGVLDLKPWLERSEIKVSAGLPKPSTLPEAVEMQSQAKGFLTDCDQQLTKLQSLSTASHQMSSKTNAPDELDALHSRWAVVNDLADQWNNKLDKLVVNWQTFDTDVNKLESWIVNGEKAIEKKVVNVETPQVEKLERELTKLKSFSNETSQQQAKIVALTQGSDSIAHSLAPDGAALIKGRVSELKQRTNNLAESVRGKINELSDQIIERQEFHTKIHTFETWMDELKRKIEHHDQLSTEKVGPSLQLMHELLQEHADKQPHFTDIYNEVKHLTLNATPDESRQLSENYTNIVKHYQHLEQQIQQNKVYLENWSEFLSWYEETKQHLGHIKYQVDSPKQGTQEFDKLKQEVEHIVEKLPTWKSNADNLDAEPRIKVTDEHYGRSLQARNLVKEIELKSETLKSQIISKKDVVEKVGARWDKFNAYQKELTDSVHQIQTSLTDMSQKPLAHNKETIEIMTQNLDVLENDLKGKQNVKKSLREEGLHLMREDQGNMGTIQNILSVADNNWDQVHNALRDTKNRYSVLSSTLQELQNFKQSYEREVNRAEQLLDACSIIPADYAQSNQALDKSKKAHEILKRSKSLLEQMDLIKQSVLKQAATLGGFNTSPVEEDFLQSQTRWEKVNDAIIKKIQDLESQVIIWKQIDESKNQILNWLSETSQNLQNATENLELKYGQSRLAKYKEELPVYTSNKNSIQSKCEQLLNMNKGTPMEHIANLNNYLENEFQILNDIAEGLETAASSLQEQEKELRRSIKAVSDSVGKLREEIIKCDDMSGDTGKVLERLRKCQVCKEELLTSSDKIDNLMLNVTELNSNYPGFSESITPKELNGLQKRYDGVLIHANKIEATLLAFLKKLYSDKLGMFERQLKALEEKTKWCIPEPGSDKYNLEVKLASLADIESGIQECQGKYTELEKATDILNAIEEPDALNEALSRRADAKNHLDNLELTHAKVKNKLEQNIKLWQSYELISENVSSWLKDVENKVRLETASQLDIDIIDKKIEEITDLNTEISQFESEINTLLSSGDKIITENPDSRVGQYVSHLTNRYQAVAKFAASYLDRIQELKSSKDTHNKNVDAFKKWLQEANLKIKEFSVLSATTAKPSSADLEELNKFTKSKDAGQTLLNGAIESGELLYSGITPDNRERIRNELRCLRDEFESSIDRVNTIIKDVETNLNKRSSFDETFSQVEKWIADKELEAGEHKLYSNLPEKKAVCHANKALSHDVSLHQNILKQLAEKVKILPDDDIHKSLDNTITKYDSLSRELESRIVDNEKSINEHEKYAELFETFRDWLNGLAAESILINIENVTEKEDGDNKHDALTKLLNQKEKGDSLLSELRAQLDIVLPHTAEAGRPALLQDYEGQKQAWNSFLNQCQDKENKLQSILNTLTESQQAIDDLDNWLKQKEALVRDQSLKSNLESKKTHLEKIRELEKEIMLRANEFATISDKSNSLEGDSDLSLRVSKLVTRYQRLRNTTKEIISKYEIFVFEHEAFEKEYKILEEWLSGMVSEINNLNEIVGDYAVLQDKQNKAREVYDNRNKKAPEFDALLGQGEKLYSHTSPDGRELIRQRIRHLRSIWDSFGDNLQETVNRLDQCLLQFTDFSVAQDQLTKWLKDIERTMQKHTELNSTLQEKKAQLQNHKIMHQEIMTHQQLVESVCEKAQQLVDQTRDASLNIYLQSIKQLFQNIVSKSQNLQDNLEECVKRHEELSNEIQQYKDWIASQAEKIAELDNVSGEKAEISRKIQILKMLKNVEIEGTKKLDIIRNLAVGVGKSTSQHGNDLINLEIDSLHDQLRNVLRSLENAENKLENTLKHWNQFEEDMESIVSWLKLTESKFRDKKLHSDLSEKEKQLNDYVTLRDEISSKEKDFDEFVDKSNSLIQESGVDRLKPLVTQTSSRYQQLHLMTKEIINHWTELVGDHKIYIQSYDEVVNWLKPLEESLNSLSSKDAKAPSHENKGSKIQVLLLEREHGDHKVASLSSAADKILPETAANGREKVRVEVRDIRDRWDKLNEKITQEQKEYETKSQQMRNYQDILQQTLSWLDEKEKNVELEAGSSWNSPQEIKAKLLKNKTLLQDINSHKRVLEAVTEKAKTIADSFSPNKTNEAAVTETIASIWSRYSDLISKLTEIIKNLEDCSEVCNHFSDQQKSLQEYQKQLWEKLHLYSDFTGNKSDLQGKLNRVQELVDAIPISKSKIKTLSEHIESNSAKLPPRAAEAMSRELITLEVDFEKFAASAGDIRRGLEQRLQQWGEYEAAYERLQKWLADAELTLKSYSPRSTLEVKVEQLHKYQDLIKVIDYRGTEMMEIICLADSLEQQLVVNLKKGEAEFDKLTDEINELIENCNETRISVNVQQMTSRFQSIQATAKEIVKKCEQAVADHIAYQDKYKQCSDWIQTAQLKFEDCKSGSQVGSKEDVIIKCEGLKDLLSQRPSAIVLLNNTTELGEKLYPSSSIEGKEIVEQQLHELQQSLDALYDSISITERDLENKLNKWSSFEESLENIKAWLLQAEKNLPKEMELKATLDEKRAQLNIYRHFSQDAIAHQQDITELENRREILPDKGDNVKKELTSLIERHKNILKRAESYVEKYEAIVNNHQQYTKAVMELQEWVESTHNTVILWGDCDLERVSLCSNCEKLKNLQIRLPEEKPRIDKIRILGEKVLPGTISGGQVNIRNQIDSSQQEWEGLASLIDSTIQSLENKLQQWNEYEQLKDQCLAWIRNTDTKIHAVDLKSSLDEKKQQSEELKELQGEVRAKELEIDNVTEKAQALHKTVVGPRASQISDLSIKYQQVSQKVKDLASRWQQYVKTHQEFETNVAECQQWFQDIKEKLNFCSDLSASTQDDFEVKLALIQNLLILKDEGFTKLQSAVELAQHVLANTAPAGHEKINDTLVKLQEEWSSLVTKMIETKNLLDDSISKWAGFLEQIKVVDKSALWLEESLKDLSQFQSTLSEKRAQLDTLKTVEEKARCEKIDVDNLKSKASEMLASGQQTQAASQAQETLNKFDGLYDKIKKLLSEREAQYRDHRLYKEASDDLISWLSRAREKVPSLKSRPLSDKLAIENSVAPLEALINKQAQGELLLEHLQHTGEVVLASTSSEGQTVIRNEMKALKEGFESLFNEIKAQKNQLEATVNQWRDYKDEYERLSDWLQQIDILIKNHKLALLCTAPEKEKQVKDVKEILDRLEKGKAEFDAFNLSASGLLNSHLDTYVTNQLRHLNSRYQVQVNLAKDVLTKVQSNFEQHKEYDDNLDKAKKWMEAAWEVTRGGTETASNSSKEALQKRLEQIQDLLRRREEGQNLVHATVNSGEKVIRNTRSDGKDKINTDLKELQNDWDRLVKKMSTAKVHLETSLLQWADYSSSYSQLQQWITDREAKLQEVCEQKVAKSKKGQSAGLQSGLSLGERKATLRQTNNIVQDIVSFEPMIQSVTSKASELMQQAPASEITNKYETLTKQAKDLYAKQKETVEQHQAFIDAGSDFVQWLRAAKEKLSKCSEPTGDKESLSSKMSQLTVLESELPEGQKKLEKALEQGEIACNVADEEDKETIEEEVALMQEEYDTYVEQLASTKSLIETGIVKWTEYEDQYKDAIEWLSKTETVVKNFNKLQNNLEQKKTVLEEFQTHLQTLFDWQTELDKLNMRAQTLLETCADTRVSNGITQLTTKYNVLLSLAKEIMKRLELHYQEHQQHNALYGECQDWLDRTRDKLNECADMPNTLQEVNNKLNTVKILRQSLEQGQNKLRYVLELKEKIIMNTEQSGAAKIQEDTENLKQEFDKLMIDVQEVRTKLTNRAAQFDEIYKMHKLLIEWLEDIQQKFETDDAFLNELSEKKAKLEKFKTIQHDINAHSDMVKKLQDKFAEDRSLQCNEIEESITKYQQLKSAINDTISILEGQVNTHIQFKESHDNFYDWVRNCKMEIQQCSDSHGEKEKINRKKSAIGKILESMPRGEALLQKSIDLSDAVTKTTGKEGQDAINQDIKQLKVEWENLQHLCKDTNKVLEKCLSAWEDFTETAEKMKTWEVEFEKKLTGAQEVDKMTPEHLEKCRNLLEEAVSKKGTLEELNDRCENLMELSACSWVRDQTVRLQSTYSALLTTIQGLVSNVEKNLSDHTEFLKAKKELQNWLETAHGTVQDSIGVGDIATTTDKLQTVKLVSNRMTEGTHLLAILQDAFTKAINNTPADKQEALRDDMKSLRESWDQLKMDLNSITAQLKAAIGRWEDFGDAKDSFIKWIASTEESLALTPDTKGELSEMKTLLEKYKHIQDSIVTKKTDLDHLKSESVELGTWAKNPAIVESVRTIEIKCEALNAKCQARKAQLDSEMQDYNLYHQSLQETEKWLLQISFQLMAHNSLYITNRQQTEEQLAQQSKLLGDIQKYLTTLDDLKAKGQAQIDRYSNTSPDIRKTIEGQLKNVNDSYQSLLTTALQIEKRLRESLAKFKEYEDTLESIMANLDSYEPAITELDVPAESLPHGRQLLESARTMHNKLQLEKSRLAAAVQACEAAAACVSRPSTPADTLAAPLAAPQRELAVRARLEDLIDQVQSYLSTLIDAVSEMEEAKRQRGEIEEWLAAQDGRVEDWLSNPTKLRPDTAKQEIRAMNDMMLALGDKKMKLATEISNAGFEDDDDLTEVIERLEAKLSKALERELANQGTIESFRQKTQEIHDWFDSILKRMEVTDKGSGLSCPQKLVAATDLHNEYESDGSKKVDNVKTIGTEVINIVSNLESQQVEEQMKSIERRYNDLSKRLQRKLQVLDITHKAIDGTRQEINDNRKWMQDNIKDIQNSEPLGFQSKAAKERQKKLVALLKDVDSKKTLIDSLEKKVNNIQNELEPSEQSQLETSLSELTSEQKQLSTLVKQAIDKVSAAAEERKKLENDLDKAHAWIKAKLSEIRKSPGYLPLKSIKIEKDLADQTVHDNEIKNFNDNMLIDIMKSGNSLYKECSTDDRARLQAQLDTISKDYDTLKKESSEKHAALVDLLRERNKFENDANKCNSWLNEAEVAISAELRTSTLPILEEQLTKYDKLDKESKEIEDLIGNISEQAKAIIPTLSDADKLQLAEQINVLKDKHARIKSIIADKNKQLVGHIKEYKDTAAKIAEALQFISDIQNRLKNLNRPIGSKVEDVQTILQAYEKILGDLKANKSKLGDLQGVKSHDLQDIIIQQDDLIKAIEDQISKLKHLLLLREQFFALITEITSFITKYTTIVGDIEKSGVPSEEKIKRYDDVILKIQECEALLATAADKGQQIAAEGTAVDRNNITEQLQSLKQQLLSLRRAVEAQRQQHERAAAEHKKLSSELTDILQWLHDNEAAVHSRPLLNRDIASTDKQLAEHATLVKNVNKYLDRIKSLQETVKQDENMPSSLREMLSDATSFVTTMPRDLADREKYLQDNKKHRQEYARLVERLEMWVSEAKIRLDMGKDGTDFENIANDLDEHKSFFSSSETTMRDLVGKQMQNAVDKIWPSLTQPEQEELSKEHQKHNQLLKNSFNSAKSRQAQLEQDYEIWKDYIQLSDKIKVILEKTKITDEPVTSLTDLYRNIETVTQALKELESQQPLLDVLRERARELESSADGASSARVESSTRSLAERWSELSDELGARSSEMGALAERWAALDAARGKLESAIAALAEKARHVEPVVRSRKQIIEERTILQELKSEAASLSEVLAEAGETAAAVTASLRAPAPTAVPALGDLHEAYDLLHKTINEKLEKVDRDIVKLDKVLGEIETLRSQIETLLSKVKTFYVFGEYVSETEKSLVELKSVVVKVIEETKKITEETKKGYLKEQNSLPSDIAQELSSLELATESLTSAMEEKTREFKRARTIRTEYAADVEAVQNWLRETELAARDRSLAPHEHAERLARAHQEIDSIGERLERASANGEVLATESRDNEERDVVRSTIATLAEQLSALRAELEARRRATADAADARARFLELLEAVRVWTVTQRDAVSRDLCLDTTDDARREVDRSTAALKSAKNQTKNLLEMAKELETIEKVASVGDLPAKLEEAENAKVEVETLLMQRTALLQELAEEWDQCEKKLNDVKHWIEKTHQTMESSQNKKKPLRDQLALQEKISGDITIQETKILYSLEKLNVHFESGVAGGASVEARAVELRAALRGVSATCEARVSALSAALAQVEAYGREAQRLRALVLQADQKLRAALAPNYSPHDRDKANRDQQECRERIKSLQSKIQARNERIKLVVQRGSPDTEPLTDT